MKRIWQSLFGVILGAAMSAPLSAADFYAGKTITILVGFGPEGGDDSSPFGTSLGGSRQRLKPQPTYDQTASLYARHLGRFLGGSPRIVTRAMPGAGSLAAARFLETSAPPDGTMLGIVGPALARQPLMAGPGGRMDSRRFGWIGGRDREIYVCAVRDGLGIERFRDFVDKRLFFGATDPRSRPYLHAAGLNLALGGHLRLVPGYVDIDDILGAMPKKEIDGICGVSLTTLRARYAEQMSAGELNVVAQFGAGKDPRLAYLQNISDLVKGDDKKVLELLDDESLYPWPLVSPPALPPERLDELRAAFDAMMKDPRTISDAGFVGLTIDPVSGPDLTAAVARLANAPSQIIAGLRKLSGLD